MDPVNLTWPHLVFETKRLINDIFDELGSHIIALHAKDVVMGGAGKDVVHVDEAIPGTGTMDYATLLKRMDALPHDITLHAEHFPYAETLQGQQYIRGVARNIGVTLG
jgi:sugar phosphate isomerase/epimerase